MTERETEDESFIVLGTSPTTSLAVNGLDGFYGKESLDHVQLDDALKDLSVEAGMAFKAHFKIGDGPSPASLMVASNMVTDNKTTEELQKSFGEIIDENVILKETLKKNNESMKEQFLLIASCQEDMMKTHLAHREKFDETRELVEKLRQENMKLKSDIVHLSGSINSQQDGITSVAGSSMTGPSSALEFVVAPDDDTINKLTAQLELVEKQRRQVIVDNEKLTWQKESLEHIVDATSKERDELKEKVKSLELHLSGMESEYALKINSLHKTIQDLHEKLQSANKISSMSAEDAMKRDSHIQQLEAKVLALQKDLKNSQLKILELENVKLEFSIHKSGLSDTAKMYKEQIQDLNNRLKEAQTTVFQPVRVSMSESDNSNSELASFMSNVKLYDTTLKHLAQLLNTITHGTSDNLANILGSIASLHDFKLDRTSADQFKSGLVDVKRQIEKQHSTAISNIAQVRGALAIFNGIFKDYNAVLKNSLIPKESKPAPNVEALTNGLLARSQEVANLKSELLKHKTDADEKELLQAQLALYKSDFEAEREAREKMASEKETILTDLRKAQRRNQEMEQQLEEVRKSHPLIYRNITSTTASQNAVQNGVTRRPRESGPNGTNTATGNMVYKCPKCMRFSSDQYKVMEDHFDFCLDDF